MNYINKNIKKDFYILLIIIFVFSCFLVCEAKPTKKVKDNKAKVPAVTDIKEAEIKDNNDTIQDDEFGIVEDNEDSKTLETEKNDSENVSKKEDKEESHNNDKNEENDEKGEEGNDGDEDASNQKVDNLLAELNKLKDSSAVIELLTKEENEELLDGNVELLTPLVEAYLNNKKPNFSALEKYSRMLCMANERSQLGNYALGLALMNNKKKPNYSKALSCLAIAKKGKKPYKDSLKLYKACWLKVYLQYIIIGVVVAVVLIVLIIIIVIKKKKAANKGNNEIDLQKLLDEPSASNVTPQGGQENLANTGANTDISQTVPSEQVVNLNSNNDITNLTTSSETIPTISNENLAQNIENQFSQSSQLTAQQPIIQAEQSQIKLPVQEPIESSFDESSSKPIINNQIEDNIKASLNSLVQPEMPRFESLSTSNSLPDNENKVVESNSSISNTGSPTKKIVRVVKKVRVRKDSEGNSYVVSEETSPQQVVSEVNNNLSNKEKINLESIKNIARPAEKPLQPVDSELDLIWEKLSQKALKGHIEQMYRTEEELPKSFKSTSISDNQVNESNNQVKDTGKIEDSLDFTNDSKKDYLQNVDLDNVSIDLSEDSLKDDLIGKLKMLAITESELEELFAMKNESHIPYLIEYIMTKPDSVRLAFVAKGIGVYADPAVVDVLSTLLYNEDERVVIGAIQGLEATGLPSAVIPLCPFLRSEKPKLAQEARMALSKFGAPKIMQALKDLPTFTDNKLKEAGIFVLSRMKGEAIETILKEMLNDESSEVRIQTILAMSYQKNPVFIEALREFYRTANDKEKSMTRKAIVYLNGFNK